ncbi:MAG TPA: YggS family pyridoxal phosphate-dependent enzyme [Microbacteriaceae bacterium]|nr:YggS family pyridoxal phosphate-dependent enzyme [Microbacteriaceae bacterium]
MTPGLSERLTVVRERIQAAARLAGRDPAEITLIAVTKFHPASLVRDLAALGQRDVGENRDQEAHAKAGELASLGLHWHFIGQLQTNKARRVVSYAHAVHSVDRPRLVDALDAAVGGENGPANGGPLDCFLQVSLDGSPGRGGVTPDGLLPLAQQVLAAAGLRLRGLMAVAPLGEDPDPAFEHLRLLSLRLRRLAPEANAISAGMSHDFEKAIAHGATHLRIGTAITGIRPTRG